MGSPLHVCKGLHSHSYSDRQRIPSKLLLTQIIYFKKSNHRRRCGAAEQLGCSQESLSSRSRDRQLPRLDEQVGHQVTWPSNPITRASSSIGERELDAEKDDRY